MSCMSQNFRLFHVSNLSVRNFRIFLLMYPGSLADNGEVSRPDKPEPAGGNKAGGNGRLPGGGAITCRALPPPAPPVTATTLGPRQVGPLPGGEARYFTAPRSSGGTHSLTPKPNARISVWGTPRAVSVRRLPQSQSADWRAESVTVGGLGSCVSHSQWTGEPGRRNDAATMSSRGRYKEREGGGGQWSIPASKHRALLWYRSALIAGAPSSYQKCPSSRQRRVLLWRQAGWAAGWGRLGVFRRWSWHIPDSYMPEHCSNYLVPTRRSDRNN